MYSLTTKKNPDPTPQLFPIALVNQKKPIIINIEETSYDIYEKKLDLLLKKMVTDPTIRDEIYEYVSSREVPKGRNKHKNLIKDMIQVLDEYFNKFYTSPNKSEMMKFPNALTRDAINIYGMAGSGKSYWASQYAKVYRTNFPDNEIYLVTTNVENDPTYKGLGMKKLDVSTREVVDGYEVDETTFQDSLVIFDDIESTDKAIYTWIREIRDMLFLKSRKHNVDLLNIIHKGLDFRNSTIPNNECTGGIFFPRHGWSEAKKILATYFELKPNQISEIGKTKKQSRWVFVSKTYPKYYITQREVKLLD